MEPTIQTIQNVSPSDVAKYFLAKAVDDGDLISNLKMQKLVYFAYVWTLVDHHQRLFKEQLQAWPNGPVAPSLYQELKEYGSAPIPEEYLGIESQEELDALIGKFPTSVRETLDKVYETYGTKSAFELAVMSHSELPWVEARKNLAATEPSNNTISDELILKQHASES